MRSETGLAPVALVALAVALLSGMDAGMKALTMTLPVLQAIWLRYMTAAVVLVPIFLGRPQRLTARSLRANALRGGVVAATAMCFFYAISVLPLALVISVAFIAPFLIALLGRILLGEPIHPRIGVGIVFGFVGVLVIFGGELRVGVSPDQFLGFAAAIAGAFGYALVSVLIRKQAASDRAQTMILLQTCTAGLIFTPFALADWQPVDAQTLSMGVLVGILGATGQLAIAAGFSRAPAARLGVLEYTGFIWAALFGFVFFSEIPRAETFAGAGIIVAACLIALRPQRAEPAGRATARAPYRPAPRDPE